MELSVIMGEMTEFNEGFEISEDRWKKAYDMENEK